ncbi:hypothetical protein IMZ48_06000 [Candidatus Bathyarchaeota archaeon]|nr:hypothetical protein [Candidatus Bathyarchaeota archaeon]
MQYMSQAMGWADCIVLAMAPLGIITAIVTAIRVGGPSWLKAIIGRARESRAIPEAELMSSTSREVCELWNGHEIVRIMGEGPMREFIILLPEGEGDGETKPKTRPPGSQPESQLQTDTTKSPESHSQTGSTDGSCDDQKIITMTLDEHNPYPREYG